MNYNIKDAMKSLSGSVQNTHINGSQVSSVILFLTVILAVVRPCVTLPAEELFCGGEA